MGQFDNQIATAKRLIKRYGQSVTWKVANQGAPVDSGEPWKPTDIAPTEHTVEICFVSEREVFWRKILSYLKGTEVALGKLSGIMSGEIPFTPALSDTILRDGKVLTVSSVDLLSPNGQKILYTLEFSE